MAMKLSTTLGHINKIPNSINASLVKEFYEYLKDIGTPENSTKISNMIVKAINIESIKL